MMKRKFLLCFLFVLLLNGTGAFAQTSAAQAPADKDVPEVWLKEKGRDLLHALSEKGVKTRYVRLRRVAKEILNLSEMVRLASGRYWRDFSPAQKADLEALFIDYFVVTYGSFAFDAKDVDIKVVEKQPSGKDVLLKTHVSVNLSAGEIENILEKAGNKNDGGKNDKKNYIEILFALRETAAGFYLRDAKIEGQSILMFLRDNVEQEYKRANQDINELLNRWRKKINARYRAAEDMERASQEKKQAN